MVGRMFDVVLTELKYQATEVPACVALLFSKGTKLS